MSQVKTWLRAVRLPFFSNPINSVILGAAVAWWTHGLFQLSHFLLVMLGIVVLCAAAQLSNEYFDFLSGADFVAEEQSSALSDGSRVLPEGELEPRSVHRASIVLMAVGSLIGLFLTLVRGPAVLVLGLIGVFSVYFYTAPPIRFQYRGLGEFVLGLNLGPLIVVGSHYVQARELAWQPLLAALPVGFLNAATIFIMKLSTHETDRRVGKNTLAVILGRQRAGKVYIALLSLVYTTVVLAVVLQALPWMSLVALSTIPIALRAARMSTEHLRTIEEPPQPTSGLLRAMGLTASLLWLTGPLLSIGCVLDRLIKRGL